MAEEGREDTTQQAPPVDQPTEDSPAVRRDDEPQIVDSTAVEEPPVRAAEEEIAPTGGPEPAPPGTGSDWSAPDGGGGTSPLEADRRGAEEQGGGRPELVALGAFAGAFLVAKIIKRLGGGD
jgi:hypothetical protein